MYVENLLGTWKAKLEENARNRRMRDRPRELQRGHVRSRDEEDGDKQMIEGR